MLYKDIELLEYSGTRNKNFSTRKGEKFGEWTVITRGENVEGCGVKDVIRFWCECSCGSIHLVSWHNLKRGSSCRCEHCAGRNISNNNEKYSEVLLRFVAYGMTKKEKKGLKNSLTKEEAWEIYEKQNRKCALSGLPIGFRTSYALVRHKKQSRYYKRWCNTASPDRIDSSKGYTKDNLQWVHKDVNMLKNIYPQEYFIFLCHLISSNMRKPNLDMKDFVEIRSLILKGEQ
jgi:hypothetical protein